MSPPKSKQNMPCGQPSLAVQRMVSVLRSTAEAGSPDASGATSEPHASSKTKAAPESKQQTRPANPLTAMVGNPTRFPIPTHSRQACSRETNYL